MNLAYSFLVCSVGLGLVELSVVECVCGSMEEGGRLSESFRVFCHELIELCFAVMFCGNLKEFWNVDKATEEKRSKGGLRLQQQGREGSVW